MMIREGEVSPHSLLLGLKKLYRLYKETTNN